MSVKLEVKTDYDIGVSSTSTDSLEALIEPPGMSEDGETPAELSKAPKVEIHRYGAGKPRRIVIRAKISHGNEDED